MELLIAAVIGGVLLALVLLKLIWTVVSAAVDNGLDWLIHTLATNVQPARSKRNGERGETGDTHRSRWMHEVEAS